MVKKYGLVIMFFVTAGLAFITSSAIMSGCAGQLPATTVYSLTSTPTKTPTP